MCSLARRSTHFSSTTSTSSTRYKIAKFGKVFSDSMALVGYGKGNLGGSPDSPQAEFSEQSPLVDFLEESGAKRVGHQGRYQARVRSANRIRVYRRSSAAHYLCAVRNQDFSYKFMAADERR